MAMQEEEEASPEIETLPFKEEMCPNLEKYRMVYRASIEDPEKFWSEKALVLDWIKKWDYVLDDSKAPFYRWFINGKLNVSYNAIDRHIQSYRKNKAAYIWIGEAGEEKIVTYYGLYKRVNAFAKALLEIGLKKGDTVTIYLPMILEAPVAMLAAARIGVTFTFVFSGFGSEALASRINDSESKVVITADGGYRRGKVIELKKIVDEALNFTKSVETVIVVKRVGNDVNMVEGRDYWWSDIVKDESSIVEPEVMDSNDPLYILYTSGTTGKPKGAVHSTGGYSVWITNTMKWAFNPDENDRWWCAADIGWVTGHSYIVFAPLMLGLTSIMYEGSLDYPAPDRMWAIIEKYGVNILYTSPTAIRALMKYGTGFPKKHDLSSLKVLGTVGEPINPAAWRWYYEIIGGSRAPIIDTYWQTETGGFIISPALGLGICNLKPGSATFPMPGIDPVILDDTGKEVKPGEKGYLAIRKPWPGLMLTLHKQPERYKEVYFSKFPGYYNCIDFAIKDEDGYFWLLGRADEVLKVAGHRIGTIEVEDALVSLEEVAEAAVFGKPHSVKGEVIISFVTLKHGYTPSAELINSIKKRIRAKLGPIMVPDEIHFVEMLPKTRSGKIMRRLIKAVYTNQDLGDISTLESEASVEEIREAIELFKKQTGGSV